MFFAGSNLLCVVSAVLLASSSSAIRIGRSSDGGRCVPDAMNGFSDVDVGDQDSSSVSSDEDSSFFDCDQDSSSVASFFDCDPDPFSSDDLPTPVLTAACGAPAEDLPTPRPIQETAGNVTFPQTVPIQETAGNVTFPAVSWMGTACGPASEENVVMPSACAAFPSASSLNDAWTGGAACGPASSPNDEIGTPRGNKPKQENKFSSPPATKTMGFPFLRPMEFRTPPAPTNNSSPVVPGAPGGPNTGEYTGFMTLVLLNAITGKEYRSTAVVTYDQLQDQSSLQVQFLPTTLFQGYMEHCYMVVEQRRAVLVIM